MDTTTDTTQIDPTLLQNLLSGDSNTSLIPESLITTLTIGFIILNILGVLFLVFFVASLIRKWKVESAVLHMQKDLAEIKAALAKPQPERAPDPEPAVPGKNPVIASNGDTQESSTRLN